MVTNRVEWVETLKFLGIVAVILGHIASPLGSFIYSWHMPFFFLIAGFFLKTDLNPLLFLRKEFQRLMFPYFIFSAIGIFVESVKRVALGREGLEWLDVMQGTLFWMDMDSLNGTYAFVLWFLPALFFILCSFQYLFDFKICSFSLAALVDRTVSVLVQCLYRTSICYR